LAGNPVEFKPPGQRGDQQGEGLWVFPDAVVVVHAMDEYGDVGAGFDGESPRRSSDFATRASPMIGGYLRIASATTA
jgi:hypothetical protein